MNAGCFASFRRLLGRAWIMALGVSLGSAALTSADEPTPKPLKALLVLGGCCHDYATQKDLLAEGIAARAHVEVTIAFDPDKTTKHLNPIYESADWAKGYDVIIHDECSSDVKDLTTIDRILAPHRAGLPAVVLHCGMHSFRSEGFPKAVTPWFEFTGLQSTGHGPQAPIDIKFSISENPILKGLENWITVNEELYNNSAGKLLDTGTALARGVQTAKDKKGVETTNDYVVVWTNDYRQQAKVFATTLGHNNATVADPRYLDLVTRGLLWSCGKLEPAYLKPFTPKQARKNIAPGKQATASSEEKGKNHFAADAIDDNPMTRWCANGPGFGQWLQVDLGQEEKVSGVELLWENQTGKYRYKVELSGDGQKWSCATDASHNDQAGPNSHDFAEATARYVRVECLGSAGGWASLRELKVFGTELVALDPAQQLRRAEAEVLDEVQVPPAFETTLFARPPMVSYPTFVAAAPDGTLYVSVDRNGSIGREPNRGSVYRLRDHDGDGRADQSVRFVENVDSPRGLVWDQDRLYLMHPPNLSAYVDRNGDGRADEEQVLVRGIAFGFADRPADHTSNGVTLGIDGWLYLAIGDFGFMDAVGADGTHLQFRGGGVVRVRTDGTGLEVFSRGTRNILEVEVDPLLNAFSRDNTNDGGGWDIRLHHFTGLEHHGYPSLFRNFPEECVKPLADYGGGSGCGGLFLSEPGFPDGYDNALLTCDWGRSIVYRHRLKARGATFDAEQEQFLSVPRVTDMDVDAQGHVYVASWKGAVFNYAGENVGYVTRVTPKGYRATPWSDPAKLSDAEVIAQLKSASHRTRLAAQRSLLRRPYREADGQALLKLVGDSSLSPASRVAALFTLTQPWADGQSGAALVAGRQSQLADSPLAEYAIRAVADAARRTAGSGQPVTAAQLGLPAALHSSEPRVRLQAVIAAALTGGIDARELTPLLVDVDQIVAHTAAQALVKREAVEACLAVVDRSDVSAAERTGALRALAALQAVDTKGKPRLAHSHADVVDALIERLVQEQSSARRTGLIAALARLYYQEGTWAGNSWGTRPDTSGPYYQPEAWSESPKILECFDRLLASNHPADVAVLVREVERMRVPLKGSVEAVVELATRDPELVPTAIGEMSRAERIPPAGVPLLLKTASATETSPELLAEAVVALAKVPDAAALKTALTTMARVYKSPLRNTHEGNAARQALLRAPSLDQFVELLDELARHREGDPSAWAEACLISVADNNKASPEARQHAGESLTAGWANGPRRVQILRGITLGELRSWSAKVIASTSDPDKQVAEAARRTAGELRLDLKPLEPSGKLVETLKPEEVLDLVLKQHGDVKRGERWFAQLNCSKCHTVRADEQPRGPFLGQVASIYRRRELAEAVLFPSKTIAQGFSTYQFVLDDGRTVSGFVTVEAADSVTIRDIDGNETRIPNKSIEARAKQPLSMMPEGLVKKIGVNDLASLVDYLESLVKK